MGEGGGEVIHCNICCEMIGSPVYVKIGERRWEVIHRVVEVLTE